MFLKLYFNMKLQIIDIFESLELFKEKHPLERIQYALQSPNLIWFRWHKHHHSSPPSWIPMKKLRVLEVSGWKLKTLWRESQVNRYLLTWSLFSIIIYGTTQSHLISKFFSFFKSFLFLYILSYVRADIRGICIKKAINIFR